MSDPIISVFSEIRHIIKAANLSPTERERLKLAMLTYFQCAEELRRIIDSSKNKQETQSLVSTIVREVRGAHFALTPHGIAKTLDGQYSYEQQKKIVREMQRFSDFLKQRLSIPSFITSGTLLGCIREGRFLSHDDDFDLAYVSEYSDRDDIISERRRIYARINEHPHYEAEEREGGHMLIKVRTESLYFYFDLFTAFCQDGYFNEFLLKPNTLSADSVLPIKQVDFMGHKAYVPKCPEALLELNYGPTWREPDPTFRFNYSEHLNYYWFLKSNPIQEPAGE